jgi:hypothetical protein
MEIERSAQMQWTATRGLQVCVHFPFLLLAKSSGPFEKRAFTALLEQPAMFPGPAATQLERKSSKEVCL